MLFGLLTHTTIMDKQKESEKKSNVKYQKLEDESPPSSSSSTSTQWKYTWFEKHFQQNKGPQYERLKEEEEDEKKHSKK